MIPVSEKIVENAKQCLEILNDDFELDMSDFTSKGNLKLVKEEDVCGTSFCIAGWQAFKEGYPEKYRNGYSVKDEDGDCFSYSLFSNSKVENNNEAWDFFYSLLWSNDREYAKERMRFVIDNKAIPKFSND